MTGVVVTTRDAAVSQLDARATPKTEVRADVAPLLAVAGVTIDKKTAKTMGLTLEKGKRVSLPLLTGEQLDLLQRRYDLMVLVRQWAGWVALALLAVSVATSRLPLRTLAIAAGLVAVIALVLPHLLAYGQLRAADTQLGALVTPLAVGGQCPGGGRRRPGRGGRRSARRRLRGAAGHPAASPQL